MVVETKELIFLTFSRKVSISQQLLALKKRKRYLEQMTRRIFLTQSRSSSRRTLQWQRR